MSMKTSREIALERRKAMSDSVKKAVANSYTTKDRVRTSDDIQMSGIKSSIVKLFKKTFSKKLSSYGESYLLLLSSFNVLGKLQKLFLDFECKHRIR